MDPTPSTAEALLGALADRPGATAAELAEVAGIGRSTAGKLLASLQAEAAWCASRAVTSMAGAAPTAGPSRHRPPAQPRTPRR